MPESNWDDELPPEQVFVNMSDGPETPMTEPVKACFRGGPLDGDFMVLPYAMWAFEVARPADLTLAVTDTDAPVPIVRGRYEIVPTEDDHLWRIARLYVWKGWNDGKPDPAPRALPDG